MSKKVNGKVWLWNIRNRKNYRKGRPYWILIKCETIKTNSKEGLKNGFVPHKILGRIHPFAKPKIIEVKPEFKEITLATKNLEFQKRENNLL